MGDTYSNLYVCPVCGGPVEMAVYRNPKADVVDKMFVDMENEEGEITAVVVDRPVDPHRPFRNAVKLHKGQGVYICWACDAECGQGAFTTDVLVLKNADAKRGLLDKLRKDKEEMPE